jgi:hypothetical protein
VVAQAVDIGADVAGVRRQAQWGRLLRRDAAVAHVAGGAQVAFEQPAFEVETAGIDRSVRAAQPHRELPALRRDDAGLRAVPGQRQARRHVHAGAAHLLDGELEALPALQLRRQAVDDADHHDVAAFVNKRQLIGQAQVGAQGGIEEA